MLRHQPPPGLTTPCSHARTLAGSPAPSLSSRPFSYTSLFPRAEAAALRAVHSGLRGRARRRRLTGAKRGRDRAQDAGVAAAGEESARQPPPVRPAHPFAWPLPRSPCECDIPPREGRPGARPRRELAAAGKRLPLPPSPHLRPAAFLLRGWGQSCCGLRGPASWVRLPLEDIFLPPDARFPHPRPVPPRSHFSSLGGLARSGLRELRPQLVRELPAMRAPGALPSVLTPDQALD